MKLDQKNDCFPPNKGNNLLPGIDEQLENFSSSMGTSYATP